MTNYPHPHHGPHQPPPPYPAGATPPPFLASGATVGGQPINRTSPGKIIAIILAVVGVLCLSGIIAAALTGGGGTDGAQSTIDEANRRAAAAAESSSPAPAPTTSSPAATTPPTTQATKAPPPVKTTPPPVELVDGVYVVGEDIPAGRYKVIDRAGDMCYWSRTANGGEGDIIDNHYGPGFPSFTARKGEAVEISGCPTFRKIK